jgi:endonuclease YncB( thermonuclease family)
MRKKITKKNLTTIVFVWASFMTSCKGPLKDISNLVLPEIQEQAQVGSNDTIALINGSDCIPRLDSYEIATLIDVIDGDSIRVAIQDSAFEVRYIGVNTPEYYSDQRPAAIEATKFNKELLSSSEIYLFKDISETDKYDRLLRYVIANGKFINLEMVKSGHAQAKKYFPDISCQDTFDQSQK